jgi:hypothetical protein
MMAPTNAYRPLSRRARALIAAAAVVASCASLTAVIVLFDAAASTPWFAADQAALVAHCQPVHAATERHACLQAVAQQAATTRVAAR